MAQTVVLLERDPNLVRSIVGGLRPHFFVHVAHSCQELRDNVERNHPEAIVLNMEASDLQDVETLHRLFPQLPIVCTHRIPDEDMWMAALSVGASDVCPVDDVGIVLTSLLRHTDSSAAA